MYSVVIDNIYSGTVKVNDIFSSFQKFPSVNAKYIGILIFKKKESLITPHPFVIITIEAISNSRNSTWLNFNAIEYSS